MTIEQPDKTTRAVCARFVLDCSGYGRVLPRLLQLEEPSRFPVREALFTHVTGDRRPTGREEGKIWACIHPEGAWIWIIPFSNGRTSVGAVAEPEFFRHYPAEPEAQLRAILMGDPNVAARLARVQFVFEPRRISGYACAVKKLCGPRQPACAAQKDRRCDRKQKRASKKQPPPRWVAKQIHFFESKSPTYS